jgi:hypothetical protein
MTFDSFVQRLQYLIILKSTRLIERGRMVSVEIYKRKSIVDELVITFLDVLKIYMAES